MLDLPPDVQPQHTPIVIAQTQRTDTKIDRVLGVCHAIGNPALTPSPGGYSAVNSLGSPAEWVRRYYKLYEQRTIGDPALVIVSQNPEHGALKEAVQPGEPRGNYWYFPEQDYLGQDQATFLVKVGGLTVKVVYLFKVEPVVDYKTEEKVCPPPSMWKISIAPSAYRVEVASHNKPLEPTR